MTPEMVSALGAVGSAIATMLAVFVSWSVWKSQRLLSQRQLLLPLWSYMSSINEINPASPVTPDIIKAVNTLELVALCCEGGMVDEAVIKRTFQPLYIKIYHQIEACSSIPGCQKTGRELLTENRSAAKLYRNLLDDHVNHGSLT